MNKLVLFIVTIIVLLIIDVPYLAINKKLYQPIITVKSIRIPYAAISWLIIAISLNYFIFNDNMLSKGQKIIKAVILAFCIYGVYNFTNMATLDIWNLNILIRDTLWGMTLFAIVTFIIESIK
jgi:uncharacterized membrane protein